MLDDATQQKIVACIKEAESKTSGEIRVFIEHHCEYVDAMQRAKEIYDAGMERAREEPARR